MNIFSKFYLTHTSGMKLLLFFLPLSLRQFFATILAALLIFIECIALILVVSLLSFSLFLRTESGTDWLTKTTQNILESLSPDDMSGFSLEVGEFSLEDGIRIQDLLLKDDHGTWLAVNDAFIDLRPFQIIDFFSEVTIPEITIDGVSYYRNPQLRDDNEDETDSNSVWIVPNVVVPLPLGKIYIENINITDIFVAGEVMALEDFAISLLADVHADALLERNKATFNVTVRERYSYVEAFIVYTPKQFYVDIIAEDRIWGRTFPLIENAYLSAEAFVRADRFPMDEEHPLTVEITADTELSGILWLEKKTSPLLSTNFSFNGTDVQFIDTYMRSGKADITIPFFSLDVESGIYEHSTAFFHIRHLNAVTPYIRGQIEGRVDFWGSLLDMHASANAYVNDLAFSQIPLERLPVEGESTIGHLFEAVVEANAQINVEDEFYLLGNIDLFGESLDLTSLFTSPVELQSDVYVDVQNIRVENTALELDNLTAQSPIFSLNYEEAAMGNYVAMLDGDLDISLNIPNFIYEALPYTLPIISRANASIAFLGEDALSLDAKLFDVLYQNFQTDNIKLYAELSEFNQLNENILPRINASLRTPSLQSVEEISALLPQVLFDSSTISILSEEDALAISLQTSGNFSLDSQVSYKPFDSEIALENLSLSFIPANQQIFLEENARISYANGISIENIHLAIVQEDVSGNADIDLFLDDQALDLSLQSTLPLPLFDYYFDMGIVAKALDLNLDISGSRFSPQGDVAISLQDIEITRRDLFQFNAEGVIENNELILGAQLGTSEQIPFQADINIPLNFNSVAIVDMNTPFTAHTLWEGDLSTFWHFVPLVSQTLTGNATLELNAFGTLAEPNFEGKAFIAKGIFEDSSLGLVISDIDMEADLGLERSFIRLYARDGSSSANSSIESDSVLVNAEIFLEDESYFIDMRGVINTFSPIKSDDLFVSLSGELAASGLLVNPSITGELNVNSGGYVFSDFGGTSITNLENVRIVSNLQERGQRIDEEIETLFDPLINIQIDVSDNFSVSGMGLESVWGGELTVFGTLSNPLAFGSLEPLSGQFDFLGNEFELTRSVISFTGDLASPIYNINVERSTGSIDSIVSISGVGSNITLELSSVPPLPTDEIIAQMLFGKPLADLGQFEALQVGTTAAQLLSPQLNQLNVLNATREAFGLDVLRFNSIENEDSSSDILSEASIEAGGFIADTVYIGVEQSIEETSLRVEVELTTNIDVEARIGTDSSQGALTWSRDY